MSHIGSIISVQNCKIEKERWLVNIHHDAMNWSLCAHILGKIYRKISKIEHGRVLKYLPSPCDSRPSKFF